MTCWRMMALLAALPILGASAVAMEVVADTPQDTPHKTKSIYDFKVKNIDGREVALSKYEGDVLLIVNVASQ